MSRMGPASRKPTNEAATKKEIDGWWKQEEALIAAKNWDAIIARVDFPVTMITDAANGMVEVEQSTREQYVASMKPFC